MSIPRRYSGCLVAPDGVAAGGAVLTALFLPAQPTVFQAAGTRILRTAIQAPRMNATCERLSAPCAARPSTAC